MRFRNQLVLLVLSMLIPAFLAASWAVWYVYSHEQTEQEQNLQEAARSFAMIVQNDLKVREATLRTLSNSPMLETGELEKFHRFAKTMAPPSPSAIVLRDASDRHLMHTRIPFGAPLLQNTASNFLQLQKLHGPNDPIVSDLYFGRIAKRWFFGIQVPVPQNKHGYAFLHMGVNAYELQSILANQRFPETWVTTIVDRNGIVIARSRNPEQFVGKQVSERTRKTLSSSLAGTYNSVTLDKIPVKAFYSRVPISGWSVLISIPEEEVSKTPMEAAAFLATAMIILLAMSIAAASWLARRSVKPVEELGETAKKMARNEEIGYTPHPVLEIDMVRRQIAYASAQIRNATLELETKVAEATVKAERAERTMQHSQKLEALGRLTGGIAHEFNNVLQTISSAVQLAKMMPEPENVVPLMDMASKAIDRATALTGQLGVFGRTQEAKQVTIYLKDQLGNFRELVKGVLPSNINFDMQLSELSWPVTVDTLQLELAFLNMILNARDAMPTGGKLTIRADNHQLTEALDTLLPGEYVRICIADTGTGMSPEVMARAIEPFYTTKASGKGTGLGLAQVYGFAKQSQGALRLSSVLGQGTTIEIFLPRTSSLPEQIQESTESDKTLTKIDGTMLFVEDDALVKDVMASALEHRGLKVIKAENADEALAILKSGVKIDAMLSDVMMPGSMNGVELAKAVLEINQAVQVILATGYSDFKITVPNVNVISKPYQIEQVAALLQSK